MSSSTGSWMAETSPLLNSLILNEIFNYFDAPELGALRLVCSAWRDAAREPWTRSVVVIVEQEEKPDEEGSSSSSSSCPTRVLEQYPAGTLYITRSLKELMSPEFDIRSRGYRNFVIENWDLSRPRRWTKLLRDFWRECGPSMSRLHLHSCTFDNLPYLMTLLVSKVPELKMLEMGKQDFVRNPPTGPPRVSAPASFVPPPKRRLHQSLTWLRVSCPRAPGPEHGWTPFLAHFPNLRRIEVAFGNNQQRFDSDSSLLRLNDLLFDLNYLKRHEDMKPAIEHLDISQLRVMVKKEDVPKRSFDLLKNLELPLTTLKLSIGGAFQDETSILNLLRNYSNTLQTLVFVKLCDRSASSLAGFPFSSPMSRLQSLELVGNVASSFTFLQFTPNLKRLAFSPFCISKYVLANHPPPAIDRKLKRAVDKSLEDPSMAEVKLEGVLELQLGYGFTKAEHAKRLGGWMPNVKRLSVTATPGFFRGICATWGHSLEELKLFSPSLFSDREIVGGLPGQGRSSSERDDRIPNITDLKNLRVFETEHPHKHQGFETIHCSHRIGHLTGRSITAGFLHLEKLETLKIYLSEWIGESVERSWRRRRGSKLNLIMEVVRACKCQSQVVVPHSDDEEEEDSDLEYNLLPLKYSSEPDSSDSEPEADDNDDEDDD